MKFELSRIIRENNVITIYPKEGPKVVIPVQGLPIQAARVIAELGAMFGLSTSSNPKAPPQDLCSHEGIDERSDKRLKLALSNPGWTMLYFVDGTPYEITPKEAIEQWRKEYPLAQVSDEIALLSFIKEHGGALKNTSKMRCICCGVDVDPTVYGHCPICDKQLI